MPDEYYIDVELDETTLRSLLLILRDGNEGQVQWTRSISEVFYGEFARADLSVIIYTKNRMPERFIVLNGRLRSTTVFYVQVQAVRLQMQALTDVLFDTIGTTEHSLTTTIQDLL